MVVQVTNGPVRGYLPAARPRYRWVACEWTADPDGGEGAEPFRAEIRTNLTWADIDAIKIFGDESLTFAELWGVLAPHVRAWNALGIDPTTGEAVPVPPPAEAGPDAFRAIDAALTVWLATQLRTAHLGGQERGKGSTGRGRLREVMNDDASE